MSSLMAQNTRFMADKMLKDLAVVMNRWNTTSTPARFDGRPTFAVNVDRSYNRIKFYLCYSQYLLAEHR